jgi:hypothetical protein
MPSTLHDLSFEQLAAALELREDSQAHLAAKAEITVRQLRALLEAAEAQKRAAEAQERAAEASASSATAVQRSSHLILAFIVICFRLCRYGFGNRVRIFGILCLSLSHPSAIKPAERTKAALFSAFDPPGKTRSRRSWGFYARALRFSQRPTPKRESRLSALDAEGNNDFFLVKPGAARHW